MCYDIQTKLETQLKRAKRKNEVDWIKELEEQLLPYWSAPIYHVSGFEHPQLLIYTNDSPNIPVASFWGLIPFWVKDQQQQMQIWNKTINARGETIFEKPSFRDAAKDKRCLLYVDGFFEHHHFRGKTYPYLIHRRDHEPLCLAGLWGEWLKQETGELIKTFTIVTTKANDLVGKIHNNPKLKEARMPLMLTVEMEEPWLSNDLAVVKELINFCLPAEDLSAYTVRRLRGKEAIGNVKEACQPYHYPELE